MNKLLNRLFNHDIILNILMKKQILIFDIDGTIVESSQLLSNEHAIILRELKKKYEIAICGGGSLPKVLEQMKNKVYFDHYFTECGCVYNKNMDKYSLQLKEMYTKNIRDHPLYRKINILIKETLAFMSQVDYDVSGHFIDLRNGIIYVSCIGMQATQKERAYFVEIDKKENIRQKLIDILSKKATELNIVEDLSIKIGGSVGIAIYPNEYDKKQILQTIHTFDYEKIVYFGDKYEPDGNDYYLLNAKEVIGHKIDSIEQTFEILQKVYL